LEITDVNKTFLEWESLNVRNWAAATQVLDTARTKRCKRPRFFIQAL